MADYRLTSGPQVFREADGATIPNDPGNRDWIAYQAWLALGNTPDPYVAPAAPAPSFLAQDLLALLTAADFTAIQTAITGSADLGLLWASLLAQKDPIVTTSARFQAGWTALSAALGATRAAVIATSLGIPTT